MNLKQHEEAKKLRREGCSINEISKILSTAKSNVSVWVRDVKLTSRQAEELRKRGLKKDVIDRRRQTRLDNESSRRGLIIKNAEKEIDLLTAREIWLIGILLYWAEGGKTQRGLVRFSNGDPHMIKFMMVFFKKICKVPKEKFRGYIHIHPHLDYKEAERYWAAESGIPLGQFFKTYRKKNKSSKNLRNSLPFGTMDIYICDTNLFLRIYGWTRGIFNVSEKIFFRKNF